MGMSRSMTHEGERRGTRGFGLLEHYLSHRRVGMAESLIPKTSRRMRILDIGCGLYPFFLKQTRFQEKYAVDKYAQGGAHELRGIDYTCQDIEAFPQLSFPQDYFDVISMLAVIEHLHPTIVPPLLKDIYRILKKGGAFICTTPAAWTDSLLRAMALLRLVSPAEINEHQDVYNHGKLSGILQQAGFAFDNIDLGYFELSMNIWGRAVK